VAGTFRLWVAGAADPWFAWLFLQVHSVLPGVHHAAFAQGMVPALRKILATEGFLAFWKVCVVVTIVASVRITRGLLLIWVVGGVGQWTG